MADHFDWLTAQDYTHRGLHGLGRVENTLSAFQSAMDRGLGIECDVRLSADGLAMVFHDETLTRLADRPERVSRLSAKQLSKVLVGPRDTIPTLGQMLQCVDGAVPILIELKSPANSRVEPLCLAVRRELEGYRGHCAVMSFDPRVSRWFWRYSPDTCRGLVLSEENARTYSATIRRYRALRRAMPHFLAYDIRDLPSSFARKQRKRGIPLLSWTVRSPALRETARHEADGCIAEGEGLA
ncbi:glycerophosphodiester phosphodiesterase family protein [Altericroceibacterium endophyticum]|uniref:glycerophosphodiester phosphodiesterase family protein n=1 Tax=Altericroceibacterium endophyticum TaxID=1808508 RepID=UPI001F45F9ED|nr:glycerophosphodiester phosphodiesterase family protein [Altericroceibacterium endophyticum]